MPYLYNLQKKQELLFKKQSPSDIRALDIIFFSKEKLARIENLDFN